MAIFLIYMFSPVIIAFLVSVFTNEPVFSNKSNTRIFFVICFIVIALMIGLRHYTNGSGDTLFYCKQWKQVAAMSLNQFKSYAVDMDMEKGYLYSVFALSRIFPKYQSLLVISGILFSYTICYFVKNNCKNPMLGFLIFNCIGIFGFMVQGLRQSVAMCICLFALEYSKKNKLIRFVLLIFLASLFHASAYLFLIVHFLKYFKMTLPSFFMFIAAGVVGFSLLPKIFELMNKFLNDEYSLGEGAEEGGFITILIYLAIVIAGLAFYDKKKDDNFYSMFFYMCCIAMLAMAMRNSVATIVERVGFYFAFGTMVIVPNCIENIEDKSLRVVVSIVVSLLFIALAIHKSTYSPLVPYEFYWR